MNSHDFWNIDQGGRRGCHAPAREWLIDRVREGWAVDLPLGGGGGWTYAVRRIDIVAEGMRVVVNEQFTGTLAEYVDLHEKRWSPDGFSDRSSPPRELWRFGVEYSDGLRITTVDDAWLSHRGGYLAPDVMIAELASSGHISNTPREFWFQPAPPPGLLRFAVEWPLADVPFATASVDLAELERSPRDAVEWPQPRIRFERRPPTGEPPGATDA